MRRGPDARAELAAGPLLVGALDTPVPYSPPFEEFYLPGKDEIERAARLLAEY